MRSIKNFWTISFWVFWRS